MSATGRSPVRLDQDAYQTPGYCVDKLLSWLDLNGRDGEPLTFLRPTPGGGKERPLRDPGGYGLPGQSRRAARHHHHQPAVFPGPPVFAEVAKRSRHGGVSAAPELPRRGEAQIVLECVSADTPVHHHPSPAIRKRGLGRMRVRVVCLGPRGEGFDSPPVSGALSAFMKTEAPGISNDPFAILAIGGRLEA